MADRCRGAASWGAAAPSRPAKRSWGRGEPQALSPGWERDGSGMGAGCSERIRGPHRSGPSSIPRGTASPTRDGGRLTARVGLRDTVGVLGDRSRCKNPLGHRSSGAHGSAKGHPRLPGRSALRTQRTQRTQYTQYTQLTQSTQSNQHTQYTQHSWGCYPLDISLFLHHPIARHSAKSSSSQHRPPQAPLPRHEVRSFPGSRSHQRTQDHPERQQDGSQLLCPEQALKRAR